LNSNFQLLFKTQKYYLFIQKKGAETLPYLSRCLSDLKKTLQKWTWNIFYKIVWYFDCFSRQWKPL